MPTTPVSPSNPLFGYQTSPPPTNQVLQDAANNLRAVEAIQNVVPNWPPLGGEIEEEIVNEGHIVEVPELVKNNNEPEPIMVAFEDENGVDGDGALGNALKQLERLDWNQDDLPFFFNRVEIRMGIAKVKKNYTKFQVLSEIIPTKVQDQVKSLLRKTENDFPNNDAYKQLKTQILKIFGPRPEASMERAKDKL